MRKTFENIQKFFLDLKEIEWIVDYYIEEIPGDDINVWCCVLLLDSQSIVRAKMVIECLDDAAVLREVALFIAAAIPDAVGVMRSDVPVTVTVSYSILEEYPQSA